MDRPYTPGSTLDCAADGGDCRVPLQHEVDLALCADLEGVADALPALPSDIGLRRLAERVKSASIRWSSEVASVQTRSLGQILEFRLLDSIHAEDVVDALWSYRRRPTQAGADRLAYMLRALFDGRRRAIGIERLALGCAHCQLSAID